MRSAAQLAQVDEGGMALTFEEIAQRAEALGIPTEALRIAAQGGSAQAPQAPDSDRIAIELVLDPEATDEEIVDVIRAELGETGHVEVLGKSLTWTPAASRQGAVRALSVRIRRKDGQTQVRVEERLRAAAVIGWVAVALPIALAGGINALLHPFIQGYYALGVGLFAAVMTLAAVLGTTITRAIKSRRRNQARQLADRLQHEFPVRARTRVAAPAEEHEARNQEVEAEEAVAQPAGTLEQQKQS